MKTTWKIFWGFIFIFMAVILVLDAVGVMAPLASSIGEISVLSMVLGAFLVAVLISRLIKGRLEQVFFPLAFLFMLFEKNIAALCGQVANPNLINNWLVLLIALLLTVGFSILLPKRKKQKHFHFDFEIDGTKKQKMGSSVVYIDCMSFNNREIESNFGSATVHFTNIEAYQNGSALVIDNSFGSVTVLVPAAWRAEVDIDNSFGSITVPKTCNTAGPVLYIKGDNSFGAVTVKYV